MVAAVSTGVRATTVVAATTASAMVSATARTAAAALAAATATATAAVAVTATAAHAVRRRLGRTGSAAAATVGVACAAALVTGCGGQAAGSGRDARDGDRAVSGAAAALVRAGSSRVATSMRMASGGTWLTITGTGGFDYVKRQGRLTLTLPADAAGDEEHKPLIELLMPGALYMKDRGEGVPAGKWVRVDTTRLPDGNLVTGGATEPLAAAELLGGAQDVTLVGVETLPDGTRVRHYRGSADIARAARATAAAARGPLEAAARGFTVTRVPFDAWLDARGRLRQVSQRFTFSSAGAAKGADRNVTVVSTTRFDGFGTAVPIAMPRPADIWTGKIVSAQAG